jgi:hypothetical protein
LLRWAGHARSQLTPIFRVLCQCSFQPFSAGISSFRDPCIDRVQLGSGPGVGSFHQSFGTNDLTQTTMGLSRDDYVRFSKDYENKKIFKADPFAVLDQEGVGKLVEMGVKLGRSTNPKLEVGICGEHGGEPSSVEFCYRVGMNYVSCSPYRVPIARLAAAQAALAGDKAETARTA